LIPFSDFRPDASLFNPGASPNTSNVIPVADGWAPAKAFSAISTALPAQCYGAIDARDATDTYTFFAMTSTGMYKYNSSTLGFDDVTPTAGATNLPNGDIWSATTYGKQYVIATNENDGPQVFDLTSSTEFAALTGSPPNAKFVKELGEYLVLAHLDSDSHAVHWSGIGDITKWTVNQDGSGKQEFADGGPIMGMATMKGGAYILQQDLIRRMTFTPQGSWTFMFDVANPSRGCVSPASIVEAAGTFFYLDEDGFYMGIEGQPIGAEKVNRYFLQTADEDFLSEVQGANDPANKIVWWRYKKTDGNFEMLGFDWQMNRWTRLEENVNFLINVHSPGYTLEGLDNISSSLDALPYSLDSRVWKGGRPAFGAFNTSHQFGYFEGANLAATLDTADVAISGPKRRTFVNGYRFITDADGHTGQIAAKDKHSSALSFSNATAPDPTGLVPARSDGRLHRFRLNVTAGETWTHAHGVEEEAMPAGNR
jgi:hypothetical protein